jgi:phage baseplate assembly protein W
MRPAGTGSLIGNGWSYPVRVGGRGGIALVTGADDIAASIRLILQTAPGERVMRPDFGCSMWDRLFEGTDPNTLGLIAQAVREALGRWEPRIDVERVDVVTGPGDTGRVDIELSYTIKATNDRRNLIHPFYVIPTEEHGP